MNAHLGPILKKYKKREGRGGGCGRVMGGSECAFGVIRKYVKRGRGRMCGKSECVFGLIKNIEK